MSANDINNHEHEIGRGGADPLDDSKNGYLLVRAIIDTIQEPLLVLGEDLSIIAASKSFYKKFNLIPETTEGMLFYNLNDGEWDIAPLRELLEKIIPERSIVEGYEIEHDFVGLGQRTMVVNAREIKYENDRKKMLLSIFDITERRQLERDKERLSQQKDILLKEMRHRIANSLQLIASILLLKAGTVQAEEAKFQLKDAHDRIMSIATVQEQLDPAGVKGEVEVEPYLKGLCESLTKSMIGGRKPITLEVKADKGKVTSDEAISLGLITTELVINALKHAFPNERAGLVTVSYEAKELVWKLTITDNGVGMPEEGSAGDRQGLGTNIVSSLAKQLSAVVTTQSSPRGAAVSVTRAAV